MHNCSTTCCSYTTILLGSALTLCCFTADPPGVSTYPKSVRYHELNLLPVAVVGSIGSVVKESFQVSRRLMLTHISDLDKEVRIDIDGRTVTGLAEIKNMLQLPPVSSPLPASVFEVPYSRNDQFTARGKELSRLHSMLSPSSRRGTCLIHSMGGVGKTQLALEYAYRHRKTYKYIFWLAAEQSSELARQFASLAKWTSPPLRRIMHGFTLSQDIAIVKDWLQSIGMLVRELF